MSLRKNLHKTLNQSFKEHKSAIIYIMVGGFNTIFSYTMMFGFTFIGIIPEISNALSCGITFIISYLLNKKFTFRSKRNHRKDFTRFAIASAISYIANLLTLILCHRILLLNEYFSLIIATFVYAVFGYILHKFWTFR